MFNNLPTTSPSRSSSFWITLRLGWLLGLSFLAFALFVTTDLTVSAATTAPAGGGASPGGASAQGYDCNQLDWGLYWYANDNHSKKAFADGSKISGYYDPKKPTIIYAHGWNQDTVVPGVVKGTHTSNGREEFDWKENGMNVNLANQWIQAGYNVGIFQWTQLADDFGVLTNGVIDFNHVSAVGEPTIAEAKIWTTQVPDVALTGDLPSSVSGNVMRWRKCDGSFTTANAPTKPVRELFYDAYKQALSRYSGPGVRLVGHSLGNQVVNGMAELAWADSSLKSNMKPGRIALVDPYWSNLNRHYLGNHFTGERVRGIASDLKSKGVIYEWAKTSGVNDLGGDKNDPLVPIISKTIYTPDFLGTLSVQERHTVAPKLYLRSFAQVAPAECRDDSPNGVCVGTGRTSFSAANTNDRAREIMNAGGTWKQQTGGKTADTNDDTFKCIDKCPPETTEFGPISVVNCQSSKIDLSTHVKHPAPGMSITDVKNNGGGTVTTSSDGQQIKYTPTKGFSGEVLIAYRLSFLNTVTSQSYTSPIASFILKVTASTSCPPVPTCPGGTVNPNVDGVWCWNAYNNPDENNWVKVSGSTMTLYQRGSDSHLGTCYQPGRVLMQGISLSSLKPTTLYDGTKYQEARGTGALLSYDNNDAQCKPHYRSVQVVWSVYQDGSQDLGLLSYDSYGHLYGVTGWGRTPPDKK